MSDQPFRALTYCSRILRSAFIVNWDPAIPSIAEFLDWGPL